MQAERKELEKNALAQQLTRAYEGLKQGPSRGTIITLAVIIAAVVLFVVFRFFWVGSTTADSSRWLMVDEAAFPEQLTSVLDNETLKGTTQHRVLRFKEARMKLSQGVRDLGNPSTTVRDKARKNVQEAVDLYDALEKESSRTPLLHQEALWGAAKGYEALGGSQNVSVAIERYEKLKKEYEKSALGKHDEKQLKRLNNPTTKQTLTDLAREFEGK